MLLGKDDSPVFDRLSSDLHSDYKVSAVKPTESRKIQLSQNVNIKYIGPTIIQSNLDQHEEDLDMTRQCAQINTPTENNLGISHSKDYSSKGASFRSSQVVHPVLKSKFQSKNRVAENQDLLHVKSPVPEENKGKRKKNMNLMSQDYFQRAVIANKD